MRWLKPLRTAAICSTLFGGGMGVGAMLILRTVAMAPPEVIVKERWVYNTTTTATTIPPVKEDLSWLNSETPVQACLRMTESDPLLCYPSTTVTTVVTTIPSTLPVPSTVPPEPSSTAPPAVVTSTGPTTPPSVATTPEQPETPPSTGTTTN